MLAKGSDSLIATSCRGSGPLSDLPCLSARTKDFAPVGTVAISWPFSLRPRDSESWRQHQERHTARVAFVAHIDVLTPPQSPEQIRPGQTLFEAMKAKKIGAQGMLG